MNTRVTVQLDETSNAEVLALLLSSTGIDTTGWFLSKEDPLNGVATHFWVTSPYGIDCAYLPLTEAGVEKIRTRILAPIPEDEYEAF